MNQNYNDIIYLLYCAVNGIEPDSVRIKDIDIERLYQLAKYHTVRAAVNIALKSAGVVDNKFDQAYKKALRKNIYLDMERISILSDFENNRIWHMPLKGAILKDLYPENGMREMSDNDILFDKDKQELTYKIMLSHGYTAEHYGISNHDVYQKPPVLNFELHTSLFDTSHPEPLYRYYADTKSMLLKDEGCEYSYHFSDEDFYVYMTAHEWKHYNSSGTGIRSLLDCYVFLKSKGDTLDFDYITEQCRKLKIGDFEKERRTLADKVFSSENLPDLSENEEKMLMYYLTAGTYGNFDNTMKKALQDQTKSGYILRNMFPNVDYMKRSVKFVNKCPVLYPIGIVYRWGRILVIRRNYLKNIIKAVNKYGK